MGHGCVVLYLVHVDDAALRKGKKLAHAESCGIEDGHLRRAGTEICHRAGWEGAAVKFRARTRVAEPNLVQEQRRKAVSIVQADLLALSWNVNHLALRR